MKKTFFLLPLVLLTTGTIAQNIRWGEVINTRYNDYIYDLRADDDLNLIICGQFSGTVDFDPGPGTANMSTGNNSNSNIFLAKYDSAGNYLWAHQFGSGFFYDEGDRVAVDNAGNIFLTGMFGGSADFDPDTINTSMLYAPVNDRARFLAKYDPLGNLIAVQNTGNAVGSLPSSQDGQSGLGCDADGNVYMSGFYGTSLTLAPGTTLGVSGLSDIYLAKYDPMLNLNWGFRVGSNDTEYSQGLYVHPAGKVILLGSFRNTIDFDPGPGTTYLTQVSSTQDGFFACYDSAGQFVYVRQLTAGTSATPIAALIDHNSNVVVAGSCAGTMDADPGPGTATVGAGFNDQAFVAAYDSTGNYRWAYAYGDIAAYNAIRYADIDSADNIYVAGNYNPMVDIDPGPDTAVFGSRYGSYVASYDPAGTFRSGFFLQEVKLRLKDGDVFLGGGFYGLVDFDPGPQVYPLQSDTANSSWYLLRMHLCGNYAATPGPVLVPSICAGDTVAFSVGQGGPVYLWEWTSGFTPVGSTSGSSLTVAVDTAAIQETVLVSSQGGCLNSPMVFATVLVNHAAVPVITQVNDSLVSTSAALTYQWYLNDTLLTGATDSIYVPLVSGVYTLMISDSNGCSAISDPVNFVMSGLVGLAIGEPSVWFEGASKQIHAKVDFNEGYYEISVFDLTGRRWYMQEGNKGLTTISASELQQGVYLVVLETASRRWVGKTVVY